MALVQDSLHLNLLSPWLGFDELSISIFTNILVADALLPL